MAIRSRPGPRPFTTICTWRAASARTASLRARSSSATRRCSAACASDSFSATALSLNTCTALAIAPTSSRRLWPSISTARSPPASVPMRCASWFNGRAILAVEIQSASSRLNRMPAAPME